MWVLLHFRNCEETTDTRHPVNVGDEDGFVVGEKGCPLFFEVGIRFFPRCHIEADNHVSGVVGDCVGSLVLVGGGDRWKGVSRYEGIGEGLGREECQERCEEQSG